MHKHFFPNSFTHNNSRYGETFIRSSTASTRAMAALKRDIVYKNDEIYNLMRALDIGDNIERLRYDKVILATREGGCALQLRSSG